MAKRGYDVLDELNQGIVDDFMPLLAQLSSSFAKKSPDAQQAAAWENLNVALDWPDEAFILVHRNPETKTIDATATGNIVFNKEGWIDDVVTHETARRQGLGRILVEGLHDKFAENGIKTVRLTSAPSRDAAGNLYTDLGYREGGTVWRTVVDSSNTWETTARQDSFELATCMIPTGIKSWVYGPAFPEKPSGLLLSIMRAHEPLYDSEFTGGAEKVNFFSEEPVDHGLAIALEILGYEQRQTRLYTLELPS